MKKEKNIGKVILITGSSSGIGRETALFLARQGYTVIASMRKLAKGVTLLETAKAEGLDLRLEQLDVNDSETAVALAAKIKDEFSALHGLINNAGYGLIGFFEAISPEEYRAQMETNFFGVMNVTRAFLPLLIQSSPAKIIQISSLSGRNALPGLGAYSASKYALEGFSESLRLEMKPFGVEVFLVEPGSFATKIFSENYVLARDFSATNLTTAKYAQKVLGFIQKIKPDSRVEKVAYLIEGILSNRKRAFRQVIGGGIGFWLRMRMPFWLAEKLIIKKLFL